MKIVVIGGSGCVGANVVHGSSPTGTTRFGQIIEAGAEDHHLRLPTGLMQFVAADDVAATVAELAVGSPAGGRVELGGPDALGVDAWARRFLKAAGDDREVIGDPHARYFGTELTGDELNPGESARIGATDFETWWAALMDTQR